MAKNKKAFKKLKVFGNYLWFIGTVLIVLLCIASLIITISINNKESKRETILNQLSVYNSKHFGYNPQSSKISEFLSIKPVLTDDLRFYLDGMVCNSYNVCNSFSLVCIIVNEPDSIDYEINGADCWEFIKDGVTYYGMPGYQAQSLESIDTISVESYNEDNFLKNLEDTLLNYDKEGISVFYDINYGLMPVTQSMKTMLLDVWDSLNETEQLIVLLTLLRETGQTTGQLADLYEKLDTIIDSNGGDFNVIH